MRGTVISNSNTNSAILGLTSHESMLRQDEQIGEKRKPSMDDAMQALERRKAGARRTAWIIAAIAAAFFIASLVQGHFAGIPNWVPPH